MKRLMLVAVCREDLKQVTGSTDTTKSGYYLTVKFEPERIR
jgi:hypothetical protein